MHKAEFTLEAVTPIFMCCASSIKGFRALAGSYFGDDVNGLKKLKNFWKYIGVEYSSMSKVQNRESRILNWALSMDLQK